MFRISVLYLIGKCLNLRFKLSDLFLTTMDLTIVRSDAIKKVTDVSRNRIKLGLPQLFVFNCPEELFIPLLQLFFLF